MLLIGNQADIPFLPVYPGGKVICKTSPENPFDTIHFHDLTCQIFGDGARPVSALDIEIRRIGTHGDDGMMHKVQRRGKSQKQNDAQGKRS